MNELIGEPKMISFENTVDFAVYNNFIFLQPTGYQKETGLVLFFCKQTKIQHLL